MERSLRAGVSSCWRAWRETGGMIFCISVGDFYIYNTVWWVVLLILLWKGIDLVVNVLRPLLWCACFVEGLVWYGLAESDGKCFSAIFEGFVCEVEHGDIEFYVECF